LWLRAMNTKRGRRRNRYNQKLARYREGIRLSLRGLSLYNMTHFTDQKGLCETVEKMFPDIAAEPSWKMVMGSWKYE
jgi:hypothetical protein